MEESTIWESFRNLIVKILIPAIVGVGINLAVTSRKKTLSVFNIFMSLMAGVGVAWLLSDVVLHLVKNEWQSPVIGLIAISGEKIANWVINKLSIDRVIESFIDWYRK